MTVTGEPQKDEVEACGRRARPGPGHGGGRAAQPAGGAGPPPQVPDTSPDMSPDTRELP